MNIELTKFKVKKNQSHRVDGLTFLNQHMEDVLLTLEDEKMYVENIFREFDHEHEYLYWYSIQGDGGQMVEESNHWVDHKHLEYWHECIDPNYKPVDFKLEVSMIPDRIKSYIKG